MGIQPVNFGEDDARRMKQIEEAVVRAMVPFTENTSPLLGLYVLLRCARVLLRKQPDAVRKQLYPVIFAFLEGRQEPAPSQDEHRLLWTPGRKN